MPQETVSSPASSVAYVISIVALLVISAWIYWPGIQGPELLDDRTSVAIIVDLQQHPERAWDFVFGDQSGTLGRSVSIATFVLEKLYLDDGIAGNKRVNIILHCLNGALVIWLFVLLFRHQQVTAYRWLALLMGGIWLLHPLQVSTVLYVVQRMAILATFFMLLALIAYLVWRRRISQGDYQLVALLPVLMFFTLGLFAKENAALLLPVILLVEAFWFQFRDRDGNLLVPLQRITLGLIAFGLMAAGVLFVIGIDNLEYKYRHRPFDMGERVLTQGRILWDYVGQWFAPQIQRMGLYHDDYTWSHTVMAPLVTLWSWLGWGVVAVVSALLLRWRAGSLLVLGVGWFLAGHLMESTVWPLELYFEHRNYFPALGLLLLPGVLYGYVVSRWTETARPLLVCLALWPLVLALMTSSLVQVWSSRPLLVAHHFNGHPDSARANTDVAVQMAQLGAADRALYYSGRAAESSFVERDGDRAVRDIALLCIARGPIGAEHISRIGAQDTRRPLGSVSTLLTLVKLLQDDQCPTIDRVQFADHLAAIYLADQDPASASPKMYANMAVLENALERYDTAFAYTEKLLRIKPHDKQGLLMQLHFATALGEDEVAARVVNTLQAIDRQGKLTVAERQTLELYLEN